MLVEAQLEMINTDDWDNLFEMEIDVAEEEAEKIVKYSKSDSRLTECNNLHIIHNKTLRRQDTMMETV